MLTSDETYTELRSLLADGGDRFGVSAVSFDLQEELLWVGNQGGHLTSYYGPGMQKYTSFQIHPTDDVRQILSTETGILALTRDSLRCQTRQGLAIFNHSTESLEEMQCMLLASQDSLLMGGHQDKLVRLDLTRVDEVQQVDIGKAGCAILRDHQRFVCTGDTSGKVTLRDPSSLCIVSTLEAHTGTLSDFDVGGNHIVTCGFANRNGNLTVDRFLMVYDIRMMRAVTPIQVLLDPLLLRFVSAFTSQFAVVSQTGQFHFVETGAIAPQTSLCTSQVNTAGAMCLTFDVSSSCKALAFGDAGGGVHLFSLGNQNGQFFNSYSRATDFAEPVEPLPAVDIDDILSPLASIPMPYTSGKLLSDWPAELCKVAYRRPVPIDKKILQTMKMVQSIGYAPNPGLRLRNQVPYKLATKKSRQRLESRDSLKEDSCVIVPKRYQKIEVKYSKMGTDEFDYNFYNRSSFSGLESAFPHSYCNVMLQVLYFIEPLRASLIGHLCRKDFCLSCELGFLFHMLDISKRIPCQANNFFRAFRTVPEASALGLILNNSHEARRKTNFGTLIQSWNRFILQQIHGETVEEEISKPVDGDADHPKSAASHLFGAQMYNENKCKCGLRQTKDLVTLVFSLVYPDIGLSGSGKFCQYTFADILKKSVCLEQTTQAWCDKCEKYQPTVQSRRLKKLPDVFTINCGMDSSQDLDFWKMQLEKSSDSSSSLCSPCRYGTCCTKKDCKFLHDLSSAETDDGVSLNDMSSAAYSAAGSWLPQSIRVKLLDDGTVDLSNSDFSAQGSEASTSDDKDAVEYDLVSVVNHVFGDPKKPETQNLVAFIRVGPSYHMRTMGGKVTQWYLFNDFVVVPVCLEEVLAYDPDWKLPCVVYYARRDLAQRHNCTAVSPITQDVFLEDKSLATRSGHRRITFTPLGIDEMLFTGDVVAMDAEFVSLIQEESELRSDGTRSTIKPSQMAAGRITCIRGQGPLKGTPFIDDYISTQEQVVDYLTKFSGIMPGDLDASMSSKHLTTLKSTYVKLRYLIDNGIKFVGHGLKTDFRVINLVVPPDQVIDTVYHFHQSHQRMISLRFLAWHFLGLKIQSVIHDSIEDSRTALKLYEKYRNLEREDRVSSELKQLYETGRNLQWKVPGMKD